MEKKTDTNPEEKKVDKSGLPWETSPYLNYNDLEDYKRKGYGTEGHQEPKAGCGGGSTDAPTPAGTGSQDVSANKPPADDVSATDLMNRQVVP